MSTPIPRARWLLCLAVPIVASALVATRAAAQGTVTGRVSAQATGEPLTETRVAVVGTNLFGVTGADGRYTIRSVPAGTFDVRVLRFGFVEMKRPAMVTSGGTTVLDFAMTPAAVQLQEVVTTATGEQRRVELGNAIGTIDAAKLAATAPITSINDLLTARTPGVSVASGLQTGSGMRVRIRGASSLNLANDPIYVIDGVRMTSSLGDNAFFLSTGGARPSRVADINPEEIENIEIVKGPSAATLYGTDAANGVIVITTQKGRTGATQWNVFGEGGVIKDINTYPTAYTIEGHTAAGGSIRGAACTLREVAARTCLVDSVRSYNVFKDPDASVLGTGNRYQAGLQVSGGTERYRFFLSGDREEETNLFTLPPFEKRRFAAANLPLRDYWEHPNALKRNSFRANLNATVVPTLDLAVSTAYINVGNRFMRESNLTAGIGSHAFGGPGYADNGNSPAGNPLHGYRQATPGEVFQEFRGQTVNRFIGSVASNWRPYSWLANRGTVGIDLASDVDLAYNYRGEGTAINTTTRLGFKDDNRTTLRNLSFDLASTATWPLRSSLTSKLTAGLQYVNFLRDVGENSGTDLPQGTTTTTPAAVPFAQELTTIQKTLGAYVEEQIAFRDRLFVTGALRSDQNSAFGTNFQHVLYPKASVSWIASDESFFPHVPKLDQLRLRASFGASGVQPGSNDALRSYEGRVINVRGTDSPGAIFTALGNPQLRPERSEEFETGFDARLFGSRANFEATYYHKRTKDALIDAIVPPSLGAAINVKRNLGAVKNEGFELGLNSQVLDWRGVAADIGVTYSTNKNRLVTLGEDVPPVVNAPTRAQSGYPLFGYWDFPILSYADKNGDGLISYSSNASLNEVVVGDSAQFIGSSQPTRMATISPGIDLFNRRVRITSLFDYKGGHYLYNNTERIRCTRPNCTGRSNPDSPLFQQARAVALIDHPKRTLAGYFEKADFTRWRELAVTVSLPDRLASRYLRARTGSFTFASRNLHVWTKYGGIDPETDRFAGDATNVPEEFQTISVPTYFTFRLNIGF